jgi:hypothetical protein
MYFRSILVISILQITQILAQVQQICQQGNCISFQLSPGTGCAWMCNYCANNLGTNNYYFQPAVCTYQSGVGCVGNPQTGVTYQCCAV